MTPKAGEPVDKHRLTQVGRALKELGMQMIPAYSPQARGCSERNFGDLAGALATGASVGGNQHAGSGQSVLARALRRRLLQVHGFPSLVKRKHDLSAMMRLV